MSDQNKPKASSALDKIMSSRADCEITSANAAKALSDAEIAQLVPQLLTNTPEGVKWNKEADYNCDGVVQKSEIRAAAMMASKAAREQGVSIDHIDLSSLDEAKGRELSDEIAGRRPSANICTAPIKPRSR